MTPWWFENNLLTRCVSCSVRSPVSRPSPKLASSRLRQRLLGAAASQTSRRKPCYRQSDLFLNSSWLYCFTHYFLRYRSFAHCQKLLVCPESLKWNSLSSQKTEHEKNRGKVTEIQCRHCASVFYYLDAECFDSKNFLRAPAWQKAVSCQRVKYDMKCF